MIQTDAYREYGPYAGKRSNQVAADVAVDNARILAHFRIPALT